MNKRILFSILFALTLTLFFGQTQEALAACSPPYTDYDYPGIGGTYCCRQKGGFGDFCNNMIDEVAWGSYCCKLFLDTGPVPPSVSGGYDNPLLAENIVQFIWQAIKYLFGIAIPVSVLLIIIGAYVMVTSGGIPSRQDKGKKIIIWTLIGLALMLIARGIIALVFLIIGA